MPLRRSFRHFESAHLTTLRDVPLFSELSPHELRTLNDLLHRRSYLQNEIIFDQDEEGQAIYFILSGSVAITRRHGEEPIATLDRGQFFGERALLEDLPRMAGACALTDTVLAVLFRDDFLALLQTHPDIAQRIAAFCSLRDGAHPIAASTAGSDTAPGRTRELPGLVAWGAILTATCLLLFICKKILWLVVPFLLALMLYYTLLPLARKMVLSGFSSRFAATTLSGAFLLLMIVAVLSFYPSAMANADLWQTALARYLTGGAALLQSLMHSLGNQFGFLRETALSQETLLSLSTLFSDRYLGQFLLGVAGWLPALLLTPIITFFLLKDSAQLRKMLGNAVPNAFFEKTLYLMHAIDRTARTYFVGLMKIALLDTCIMTAGFAALGLGAPLLLGLMVAVLNWIPYLGPLLGLAIVLMITATDFPGQLPLVYAIIGLFAALRALDDLVFLPLIVGRSLRIHPLLTLLMFLVGEAIAGIAGLMLVIPVLGVLMVLGETTERILTDTRLQARHAHANRLRRQAAGRGLVQPD